MSGTTRAQFGDTLSLVSSGVAEQSPIKTVLKDGTRKVFHLADDTIARPGFTIVEWYGSVEPQNMIDGDVWNEIT